MRHFLRGKGLIFTEYDEEERVRYCELEQGIILGEDDSEEAEQISIESLMDCLESEDQHEDVLTKVSNEDIEPYVSKIEYVCVYV